MTVKCGGESEIDVELEEDGSLALSRLKAPCANATGLCFTSENGRRRPVRVVDHKCFPPQGKWEERVYEVVVPETDVNGTMMKKFCIPFSLHFWEVEVLSTYHAKFYLKIRTGSQVILSTFLGFSRPPLFDSKMTGRIKNELALVNQIGSVRRIRISPKHRG